MRRAFLLGRMHDAYAVKTYGAKLRISSNSNWEVFKLRM
jgi:hypothetical protein